MCPPTITDPHGGGVSVPPFFFPEDITLPIVLDEIDSNFFRPPTPPASTATIVIAAVTDEASIPSLEELIAREKEEQEAALRAYQQEEDSAYLHLSSKYDDYKHQRDLPDDWFRCRICGAQATSMDTLKSHLGGDRTEPGSCPELTKDPLFVESQAEKRRATSA